ncbi:MAG: hypothetical protein RI894_1636 [Bacteroidota bacterium]|jgi:hypothetical protein
MLIYGIRHHGPGSAQTLLQALQRQQPDCVLIEGSPDANELIANVANIGLVPPVAMLVYNPKNLQQAAYYPFVEYSPEWVAMQFAVANKVCVAFMDLPQSMQFGNVQDLFAEAKMADEVTGEAADGDTIIRRDPLRYLAELAGYTDGERWWEATFEHGENPETAFEGVITLMRELRDRLTGPETLAEQQREAFMRQTIRGAMKEGRKNIAVVCGAWHAPALQDMPLFKAKADADLLKPLKKIKVEATWVAWTYQRIATSSGYGAGVASPHWYSILYQYKKNAVVQWMTEAAHLLRRKDLEASSANVIEAVRLAQTLASLRGLPVAGIAELSESAVTALANGNPEYFKLIENELIIGDKLGEVPVELATLPFQQDLEASIKKLKLERNPKRQPINAHLKDPKKQHFIDLRLEMDLLKSHLLWRLMLLNIPWGISTQAKSKTKGSFHEYWDLQWLPEYALRVMEAGTWGNTVEDATVAYLKQYLQKADTLQALVTVAEQVLKANTPAILASLLRALQRKAATTQDVALLIDALPPLVNIVSYGDTRGTDTTQVASIIGELIPRIAVGLPAACLHIVSDVAQDYFKRLIELNRCISILNEKNYTETWRDTLAKIAVQNGTYPLISGTCTRLLFDAKVWTTEQIATQLHFALSQAQDPHLSVTWLEGFTHGSGQVLIYHTELWAIIDDWLFTINETQFTDLLPLMRRAFSHFTPPERAKMLNLAINGTANISHKAAPETDLRADLVADLLPNFLILCGFDENIATV